MERKQSRRAQSQKHQSKSSSHRSQKRNSYRRDDDRRKSRPPDRSSRNPTPKKSITYPSPVQSEHNSPEQNLDDLIFGRHTVIAAIEHGRSLNKIWFLPQLKRNTKLAPLLQQAKENGAILNETSALRLDQLTQHATHQGIVAQVGACEYYALHELISAARKITETPVLVAIDGITDPHNLGAIIRSAEAMGVQGLVLPQRRTASVGATVAKVAAGALESLPIARVINLNQALETLKREGFWIYGLTLETDSVIQDTDLSGAIVLLIGSEGKGLSSVTQKHCDGTLKIPLSGATESLNASVAAGIGIYEIFRQRLKKHPRAHPDSQNNC